MAILHPQECYLLERFISPEHYAETRDAIIAYIDAHEAALARYKREMPLNSRKLPLWQQADVIWGNRVMPNIRDLREHFMTRTIQRINNDPDAFKMGGAMRYVTKGIVEFWNGWMMEEEIENISELEGVAAQLDRKLSATLSRVWEEGELTYDAEDILCYFPLPKQIPRYELDLSVRIEIGEKPKLTGIYLPDVNFSPACFIQEQYDFSPETRQGIERREYISRSGKRGYCWRTAGWVETGWTLIRRVEGEFIDVPREGFFPEGKPEELYNWPQREQELQREKRVRIKCWTDETAPHAGQWAAIVNGTTQYIQTRKGQKMPEFEDIYGKKHRAYWSLLKRDDKGSVYIIPE